VLDNVLSAGERVLVTFWVGGMWVIGFVVAPTLFAWLDDRALAGTIAGSLFTTMSYAGIFCGAALLALNWFRCRERPLTGWRTLVIAGMLVLIVIGEFVLAPMISELRTAGLVDDPRFGLLHGTAAGIYVINSMLGLALVATRPASNAG